MTKWLPISQDLKERVREEEYKTQWQPPEIMELIPEYKQAEPVKAWQPPEVETAIEAPTKPSKLHPLYTAPKVEKEEPVSVPFWQRALETFAAPFVWIDENIIKPGLALASTTVGLVPEVEREIGEDFWKWKKRAWEAWEAPGINLNVPWSDEPWRIDFKGVAELAPWLLIPGAGQVGAGARAARGLAGFAGKFGKLGKAVGYAVEYSPWGLVEKTAGATLKVGARAIGKSVERVSTKTGEKIFGKIPEPVISPSVKKLTTFFDEVVLPARKEFEKGLPALRAKQAAQVEGIWARVRKGELTTLEGTNLAEKATAVGGIKAGFGVKVNVFTKEEVGELLGEVVKSAERGLVTRDTSIALRDLLMTGALPEPHHIKAFARIFGDDFAKSVVKFGNLNPNVKDNIIDLLNLPRAVLATGDLSATLRQGLFLILTHPKKAPGAFWKQLKAFASEKMTLEMDDALRTHPLFREAVENGVEFTTISKNAISRFKEEPFFSNLAEKVPTVRRSERAFTTFLNEMRMGAYEAANGAMKAYGESEIRAAMSMGGKAVGVAQRKMESDAKLLGKFINVASGRGTLPGGLDKFAPVLNIALFSAKYQMSTLQMFPTLGKMFLSKNPYMRKEAAKAFLTFIGGGSALVGLINATGAGKVEMDPRSGDFGKVVIGETRLDIWRGFVQYARFAAQMLTGERKSAYGNMNKADRFDIALRFLQSKESPALGLLTDLLKGENYMGEPLFNETTGFTKMARDRLMPLALQDVMDAMEQNGTNGIWTAIPATLGIGVLTYVNDFVKTKQRIARQLGYDNWEEIDPLTQRQIQNSNVELQKAYIEFDRRVMGTAWGDWRLAGNAIESVFEENVNLAVNQFRATGDGYQFREKVNDAFTARRGGYDARDKEPRFEDIVKRLGTEDMAEAAISLGPEQMAIRTYNDALWGDDMYDEFGDYRFDKAEERKQMLRDSLGQEMFDYVEQYRGLKYEDLPMEYQELVKARKVMKPYWKIREDVEEIWGKAKTPSQQRRLDSIISRMRKKLRRIDSEVAYYYDLFYAQA